MVLLLLCKKENETHGVQNDEGGQDVELEEGIIFLHVGLLPRLVPEEEKEWIDLLWMQPLTRKRS